MSPTQTANGLLFHGDGLDVQIWFIVDQESVVATLLKPLGSVRRIM